MTTSKNSRDYLAEKMLSEAAQNLPNLHGKNIAAVLLGKIGGAKGGHARAKALSAERRREIAIAANQARWNKKADSA